MDTKTPATKETPSSTPGVLSSGESSDSSAMAPPTEQKRGWLTTLRDDIDPARSDIPIISCCFVSGLCDSVAFNASNVFVSMQTGKSISRKPRVVNEPLGLTSHRQETPSSSPSALPISRTAHPHSGSRLLSPSRPSGPAAIASARPAASATSARQRSRSHSWSSHCSSSSPRRWRRAASSLPSP